MSVDVAALKAPSPDTLDEWLATPRPARCGGFFTPSEPFWWPDKSTTPGLYWQVALECVSPDWRCWLHVALAYRMSELRQSSVAFLVSVLSRAAQLELNPLNEDHLVDLRERFNKNEFSALVSFISFWQGCESIEWRPSQSLADAYKKMPKKKKSRADPILSLDPELGPFTQAEQDALYQWLNEQFSQGEIDIEHYLYLRLLMIYGQRGVQLRMMIFDDFSKCAQGSIIRIHWAKQRDDDGEGFRSKSENFNLDENLYSVIQSYKAIILARLKNEYPSEADWDTAIKNVPLFRRKRAHQFILGENGKNAPVLVEYPELKALEYGPQAKFHVSPSSCKCWLQHIETMLGFPISSRTHKPLKISKGHRFRYTLGTDLSNSGLDEWSIARALMHKNTRTVRKYRQISPELMKLIDEKMSDHLALVVGAFTGSIVRDRAFAVNGELADRQIEDLAVCGASAICHLDAPFSCYACSKFQPLLEADHTAALERMERRRANTIAIDKTTGVVWDRAILACRKVILDCKALRKSVGSDSSEP